MKKILSLFSVMTISATAIPTTIAASSYQKQENKLENTKINYQQTKNLEKLKRFKRSKEYSIRYGGQVYYNDYKIENIHHKIKDIIVSDNNSGYFLSEEGYVYFCFWAWGYDAKRIDIRFENDPLPEIRNVKSIYTKNGVVYYNTINGVYSIASGNTWETKKQTDEEVKNISFSDNDPNFEYKENLANVIKNIELGSLNDNNKDTILAAVKAKNPNLDINDNLEVNQINSTSANIDSNEKKYYNSNKYKNYQKVYFKTRQSINDVITNTQLGSLNDNNKDTILAAVKAKNPNLDISEVGVSRITRTSADIDGSTYYNSNKYKNYQKVYFTFKKDLSNIITNTNLNIINDSDEAILNELNYLNPNLNISQLELTNKTKEAITIKSKSDSSKYYGEKKIYYVINYQQNKIINLEELIKKGIFLNFRDKNQEIIIKEIKNINTNNLIYSNVIVTKSIEPIYTKTSKNICSGKTILENNLSTEQKLKTSNCKYTIQNIENFQITTGLNKTTGSQTNSEVTSGVTNSNILTNGSQIGHSQINSSSNSSEISVNTGFSLFGFGMSLSGNEGYQTSSTSERNLSTTYSSSEEILKSFSNNFAKSVSLSNSFDLSNSKEQQKIEIFELELPFQEINVEGNQTIEVSTFLDKVLVQVILNLNEDIHGNIIAKIITSNNEEKTIQLSIKEIMQKLSQYNLLPQEIKINVDDTITFNGKANFSYQTSTIGKTSIKEIETI